MDKINRIMNQQIINDELRTLYITMSEMLKIYHTYVKHSERKGKGKGKGTVSR